MIKRDHVANGFFLFMKKNVTELDCQELTFTSISDLPEKSATKYYDAADFILSMDSNEVFYQCPYQPTAKCSMEEGCVTCSIFEKRSKV